VSRRLTEACLETSVCQADVRDVSTMLVIALSLITKPEGPEADTLRDYLDKVMSVCDKKRRALLNPVFFTRTFSSFGIDGTVPLSIRPLSGRSRSSKSCGPRASDARRPSSPLPPFPGRWRLRVKGSKWIKRKTRARGAVTETTTSRTLGGCSNSTLCSSLRVW
jgi:hypothetical protein